MRKHKSNFGAWCRVLAIGMGISGLVTAVVSTFMGNETLVAGGWAATIGSIVMLWQGTPINKL
jgi:hypothetical protein